MSDRDRSSRRMLAGLLADSHSMSFERLPECVNAHASVAGFSEVLIYLGDLQRVTLRLLNRDAGEPGGYGAELPMGGTIPGRAYQYGTVLPATPAESGTSRWWVPLVDCPPERLGVLRVTSAHDDAHAQEDMLALATLVAVLVSSSRGTSDSYDRLTRTQPMNVAAEMQWQMMPPRTYTDNRILVAAAMEPAYLISGDAYEYATDGDMVHLSIFDAMGHDTAAGLTANLAVGACRNHRRQGTGLADLGDAIERVLIEQFGETRFVTGILADLDTVTGVLSWINRGHHPPVIIRGGRWTTHLGCPPAHPMGTDLGLPTHVCREQLEPGDRVVLYTDGITEARRVGGQEFGLERFTDFLIRHHHDGLPIAETMRRLVLNHRTYHEGHLTDDATLLFCEWLGPTHVPGPTTLVRIAD